MQSNLVKQLIQSARKTTTVTCPISGIKFEVTPLSASDDLILRSMGVSAETADEQLCELLYRRCNNDDIKSINDFKRMICQPDRTVLAFSVLSVTYDTLAPKDITCDNCGTTYNNIILPISKVSAKVKTWDKESPYLSYVETFDLEELVSDTIKQVEVAICLPPIERLLNIYNLLGRETCRRNLQKYGSALAARDSAALVVKQITIVPSEGEPERITELKQIHTLLNDLPLSISEKINEKFIEVFSDYSPTYTVKFKCKNCKHVNEITISPEAELTLKAVEFLLKALR